MATAELAMRIAVPVDEVWAALAGSDMVQLMLEIYAESVDVDTSTPGPGTVLVTALKRGGVVRERVDYLDNDEHCMRYRVLDAGPFPYANYRGEMRVQPCGPEACVVSLDCTFIPVDMTAAEAIQCWLDHNLDVLNALKQRVERH